MSEVNIEGEAHNNKKGKATVSYLPPSVEINLQFACQGVANDMIIEQK